MSHAQSSLFFWLTSPAHATRTPNPTSSLFPSHGDDHCDEPRHGATFGQLAESNLPTVFILTSRRTETATFARRPRQQGLLAENALAQPYLKQKFLVTWYWQITKFLVKDVNLETITDKLSWYKIWQHSGFNHIRAKQKILRNQKRTSQSSWSRRGNRKSVILTIPQNLAKLVKTYLGTICQHLITVQRQLVVLKERYAELRKELLQYCCDQIWMKIGGRIPWSVTAICETYKISCLMGRHPMEGDSEYHLMARLFHLVRWLNVTLFLPKTCRDFINSVQKSYKVYSLDMRCTRGESGKETSWSQILRNWKGWTQWKSTLGDSM